jgi:tRNA pseudouridine55 synthase
VATESLNAGTVPACGIIRVDKPAGMTSHDVVDRIRRASGIKKMGHGGTLDPFATGLLLLMAGKATRLFDYLAPLSKTYRVTVQFGAVSSTGDIDGEIKPGGGRVDRGVLETVLPRFSGRIEQRPPAYSAIKVGGEPLYRKARRGLTVEAPLRQVEVKSLVLNSFDEEAQRAVMTVSCSKGTYIRSLCEDIGTAAGTSAYALELRRMAVGDFSVNGAATPGELAALPADELLNEHNPAFISCLSALYFLPERELDNDEARAVSHGKPIVGTETEPVRLAAGGRLMAIYGPGEQTGLIYPRLILV